MPLTDEDIKKLDEMLARVAQMFVRHDEAVRRANTGYYRKLSEAGSVILTPEGNIVIKDKEL